MIAALSLLLAAAAAEPEKVTLREAVERATARATGSVVAAEEVRRAEGLLAQARSSSLPALGATGTLTRLDADRTFQGRVIIDRDQRSAVAALQLPLVAPSRWFQWAHASQAADAAAAGEADARRAAGLAAARAYLSVLAARRAVEVSESAAAAARAHRDFARGRRRGGLGTALDELRAEQETAAAEVQLQAALQSLSRTREALGVLAGADRPLDAAEESAMSAAPPAEEALAGAEAERADVRAARARADAALRVSKDAWADWLPTLTATLQGFYQDPATLTTPRTGWQALLVLQVPLFEGGLRLGQARERDAAAKQAEAQLEGAVRQARSEVRVAFDAVQRSRAALEAARLGARSASEALALAEEAYRAGAVNNLEVIDAEQRSRAASLSGVIAEDALRQSLLDLLAAAGRFP